MCRPEQGGISHLQDAQDLVRGLGLAQDLVRPLQMRNQFKVKLTPYF